MSSETAVNWMWQVCTDCKRTFDASNRKRKKPELIGNSMFQSRRPSSRCFLHWLGNGNDTQPKRRPVTLGGLGETRLTCGGADFVIMANPKIP
jgi:hypothetical protein